MQLGQQLWVPRFLSIPSGVPWNLVRMWNLCVLQQPMRMEAPFKGRLFRMESRCKNGMSSSTSGAWTKSFKEEAFKESQCYPSLLLPLQYLVCFSIYNSIRVSKCHVFLFAKSLPCIKETKLWLRRSTLVATISNFSRSSWGLRSKLAAAQVAV